MRLRRPKTFEDALETLADDLALVAHGWNAPGPEQLNELAERALALLAQYRYEKEMVVR